MLIQRLTLSLKNRANPYPKKDFNPTISVHFICLFLQTNSVATGANYGVGLIFCILQSAHPPIDLTRNNLTPCTELKDVFIFLPLDANK